MYNLWDLCFSFSVQITIYLLHILVLKLVAFSVLRDVVISSCLIICGLNLILCLLCAYMFTCLSCPSMHDINSIYHQICVCQLCSNYIFILVLTHWLQWIRQRQLQEERRNIKVLWFGVTYIRDFTVHFTVFIIKTLKQQVQFCDNHVPLLGVRSWNNVMGCMSFCILMRILKQWFS